MFAKSCYIGSKIGSDPLLGSEELPADVHELKPAVMLTGET